MIYLPDLDYWNAEIIDLVAKVDIALVDGTFYTKKELPRMDTVPHPPIEESTNKLIGLSTEIYFTHFNHTNKILNLNLQINN